MLYHSRNLRKGTPWTLLVYNIGKILNETTSSFQLFYIFIILYNHLNLSSIYKRGIYSPYKLLSVKIRI